MRKGISADVFEENTPELLEALQIKLPDTLEKNQPIAHTYKELSRKG